MVVAICIGMTVKRTQKIAQQSKSVKTSFWVGCRKVNWQNVLAKSPPNKQRWHMELWRLIYTPLSYIKTPIEQHCIVLTQHLSALLNYVLYIHFHWNVLFDLEIKCTMSDIKTNLTHRGTNSVYSMWQQQCNKLILNRTQWFHASCYLTHRDNEIEINL